MTAAIDKFAPAQDMIIAQGRCVRQVTPSDTVDLVEVTKSLLCTVSGNVCVEPADGYFDGATPPSKITTGLVIAMTAGQVFDTIRVRRVYSTGTSATVLAVS